MGDKVEARKIMSAAAVPVVPGSPGTLETEEEVLEIARAIGFPIMVKAAAGGGGKGLRFVEDEKNLASIVRTVASESEIVIWRRPLLRRKFLKQPRHIEVQVLADSVRQCGARVRARMLDSAAASEGRRGIAVAVHHRWDAPCDGRSRGAGRARGRVR